MSFSGSLAFFYVFFLCSIDVTHEKNTFRYVYDMNDLRMTLDLKVFKLMWFDKFHINLKINCAKF